MPLTVAIAAFLILADPIEGWPLVSPESGRFAIRMPAKPTETRKRTITEEGPSEVVILQSSGGRTAYLVTFVDVSAEAARTPKVLLDGTRDVVVLSSKGKLLSEKKIILGRNPGRELRAEVPLGEDRKGGILKCRIYLVGRRVFQVMAIGPKDDAGSKEIDAYFRSFRPSPTR